MVAEHQPFVAGVYPMLLDESCFFLAVDFDKDGWFDDAGAFLETCHTMEVPAALERSRSGQGGHVWIFVDEAIPASLARKLGSCLLTETMTRRPEIGFASYDRFFPNQDTLPQGGFGNLIALPLQKTARERGNSVFIKPDSAPYADQWAFLSSIPRIGRSFIESLVTDGERKGSILGVRLPPDDDGDVEPWITPKNERSKPRRIKEDLPASLDLVLADQIYIAKNLLPPGLRNEFLRLAAFQNPEFYKAQAMRLPTFDKPRIIACAEDRPRHIGLPRGCLDEAMALMSELKIRPNLSDERQPGTALQVTFRGELRPEQAHAAAAMLSHDTGVLSATTAFGKTVIAAWMIAERRVSTLVLLHRRQLLDQWITRLSTFLGLREEEIGRIGGGRDRANGSLDVALIQSLYRKGQVDDRVGSYGQMIVDECHHLPAYSFEQVARKARARYVIGLSATVTRKDGHHPIVMMQCGPIRYRVSARAQATVRPFEHSVIVRPTSFRGNETSGDRRIEFQNLCRELVDDDARNHLVCSDVLDAVSVGRSPLVLTERNDHLDRFVWLLREVVPHLIVLRGGMGVKQRQATAAQLAAVPPNEGRVLLATGKYVGEGFDDPRLDTLMLTLPISWRGTIAQYVGRLHRLRDGKKEVRVYDYADLDVPMLARMFERRCRGYEAVGYKIELPASAVPGWPAAVTLPADLGWKRNYAATVRRLIRDGVEAPLANLFANAARPIDPDARGCERARSSAEALLFGRLDTLPPTAGRFQLNADLPIPFDSRGRMEVDLLCQDVRLVVEVDGTQHLNDPEAYRRDRRKDHILQENGYFVLRFLAEDVISSLDVVLDTILRSLAHQNACGPDTRR